MALGCYKSHDVKQKKVFTQALSQWQDIRTAGNKTAIEIGTEAGKKHSFSNESFLPSWYESYLLVFWSYKSHLL